MVVCPLDVVPTMDMDDPPIVFPLLSKTNPESGTEDKADESIEIVTEG
mgnify:CR=1 FL=1